MIFDPQESIPLFEKGGRQSLFQELDQRVVTAILKQPIISIVDAPEGLPVHEREFDQYPAFEADFTGNLARWQKHRPPMKWSPSRNIGDAMELLALIQETEYMKTRLTSSYYHGLSVTVSTPHESQSGYEEGMRSAYCWCVVQEDLPEIITRACLYAMGCDVAIPDLYNLSDAMSGRDSEVMLAERVEEEASKQDRLVQFLKSKHPELLHPSLIKEQPLYALQVRLGKEPWRRVPYQKKCGLHQAEAKLRLFQTKQRRILKALQKEKLGVVPFEYRLQQVKADEPPISTKTVKNKYILGIDLLSTKEKQAAYLAWARENGVNL